MEGYGSTTIGPMDILAQFNFKSLIELIQTFNNEQKCISFLETILWNNQPVSPFDKTSKVYKCANNQYRCRNTGKYFNVKKNTIFEGGKISLQKWFAAIWLYTSHKVGLSSMQLQRELNLTQKTTWFLLQKLRNCSGFENKHTLDNEVEIDETYVGGKNKNRHYDKKVPRSQGRSYKDKVPVLGMIERGGKVVAHVVQSVNADELVPILLKTINIFSTVYTDEWGAYNDLHKYFEHYIVNHGKKEYVNGNATTNNIENFWGNLKRGIIGVYRVVSKKHLQRYVNEFVFKRNTYKHKPNERFMHLISNVTGYKLTHQQLIAS